MSVGAIQSFPPGEPGSYFSPYSERISLAAGAVIPQGAWLVSGGWTLRYEGMQTQAFPAGFCLSDGFNAHSTGAGFAFRIR